MKSKGTSLDVVIFCGGRGTRLSEKTREMPKPLIELGENPILWHIMKIYSTFSCNRFILTLGYKGDMIIDYFLNRHSIQQNFTINLSDIVLPQAKESWTIAFVQTGLESKTAKRLLLCKDQINSDRFLVTYGDGVADINLDALIKHHEKIRRENGIIATITITKPYSKYGIVKFDGNIVEKFSEKPQMDEFINVGFMVLEKEVFDYIDQSSDVMFEETLEAIARDHKLGYYIHDGFWHAMDTYKDYMDMNEMWRADPKWKIWKN
ncbi:MAG: sugar phosphate nucleotidyltransferase [Methanoregula sp.]|jgi:glucose-1-phosphate cytidylyltransferase|uniref:sugar phosphate nucleotidyltransferase n=1 Tax=Methanoregula sp. TaxID=2052170 RepID=UPI003D0FFC1E